MMCYFKTWTDLFNMIDVTHMEAEVTWPIFFTGHVGSTHVYFTHWLWFKAGAQMHIPISLVINRIQHLLDFWRNVVPALISFPQLSIIRCSHANRKACQRKGPAVEGKVHWGNKMWFVLTGFPQPVPLAVLAPGFLHWPVPGRL